MGDGGEGTQAAWLTAQRNLHGFTMGKTEKYSDFVIEMGRLRHLHAQREKHTKEPEEAENSRELVNLFLNAIHEPGLKEEVWSLMKMDRDPKLTKLLDYIAHARKHRSKADLLVKTYKCPTHPNANSHDFKDCWNNRRGRCNPPWLPRRPNDDHRSGRWFQNTSQLFECESDPNATS